MPSKFLAHEALIRCRELRQRQTPAEACLWNLLRNKRCAGIKFYRQWAIFYEVPAKESFFIADFYSSELRLVIELDGLIHERTAEYDRARDEILKIYKLRVLRFPNEVVLEQPEKVIEAIQKLS